MPVSSLLGIIDREPEPGVIDDEHLGRMTLGDRRLEREVLEIFMRQVGITLDRIAAAEPAVAAAAAHTLNGSARGIGAWGVAQAAERLERAAAGQPGTAAMDRAIGELECAANEARAAIDARLARWFGHDSRDR
jgi:HPt (histidine-containing phosphotransfer) domain-containing protein